MTDTPLTDGIFSKLSEDELLLINAVYNDKLIQIEKLQSELDYQKQAEMEYNEKHTRLMSKYQESIEEIKRLKDMLNSAESLNLMLIEQANEKEDIIDRAVEYITSEESIETFRTLVSREEWLKINHKLLNILQGSDEE